jgi:hypothetical protein
MWARQAAIGLGVAIIFPLLVYYGVRTFHAPPVWSEIVTVSARVYDAQTSPEERQANEQKRRQQEQAYNAAAKSFARILVVVSAPLGIAAFLVGAYLANVAIGTGLILGGIFTVTHGYWEYWRFADDWLRFVSLLVALALLIFVGYRRYGST